LFCCGEKNLQKTGKKKSKEKLKGTKGHKGKRMVSIIEKNIKGIKNTKGKNAEYKSRWLRRVLLPHRGAQLRSTQGKASLTRGDKSGQNIEWRRRMQTGALL
jgi:hypothetical protein